MKVGDITITGCENCSMIKCGRDDHEEEVYEEEMYGRDDCEEENQTDHKVVSIEHVERHLAYTGDQFIDLLTTGKDTRPPGTIITLKCTVCGATSTLHKVVK